MAGRRGALHAHQGDHRRVGRQVGPQRRRVEVGQHVALVGGDEGRAERCPLAAGDAGGLVGRGLFCLLYTSRCV